MQVPNSILERKMYLKYFVFMIRSISNKNLEVLMVLRVQNRVKITGGLGFYLSQICFFIDKLLKINTFSIICSHYGINIVKCLGKLRKKKGLNRFIPSNI